MNNRQRLLLILLTGGILRVAAISIAAYTQYKPVDVYYADVQAAHDIQNFQNPYTALYHLHGVTSYGFAYLPVVPLYYFFFLLITGEIRAGSILADLIIILSLYSISKSVQSKWSTYAALAYAILPTSIWLTSVSATNMMLGAMLLLVSLAFLVNEKHFPSMVFFGLALAANQLVFLSIPIFAYYLWRRKRARLFFVSVAISAAVILPFYFLSPALFVSSALTFQFARSLQSDGWASLYSIVFTTTGFKIDAWIRVALLIVGESAIVPICSSTKIRLLLGVSALLLIGAFVLPVNGFWNYYLLPSAILCSLLPRFVMYLRKNKMKLNGPCIQAN